MKIKLCALVLLFAFTSQIHSQTTYNYLSTPSLTFATQHYNWFNGTSNITYKFVGDTMLCNQNLLIYQQAPPSTYKVYMRVENGKVWRKTNYLNPCDNELLMYDFDLEVGDIYTDNFFSTDYQVVNTGTFTMTNGEERKQLSLVNYDIGSSIEWVDGIGTLAGGLFPISDFEGQTSLVCVKNDMETILLSPQHPSELCDSLSCFTPVPNFEFEVDGFQVHFDNYSVNQSTLLWDFGDGQTSTELHPSHTYQNPGCYNVTLTLQSNCLNSTFVKDLLVSVCVTPDWIVNTPNLTTNSISVKFVNENVGWLKDREKIWKTEDGGITWTEQFYPIPPAPINRRLGKLDMANEMNGVIATLNYSAPDSLKAILITNDGGLTWEEKMPHSYFLSDAIMTDDGQVFGTGQFKGVFYSNDWGNNFIEIPTDPIDFSTFKYLGNNTVVAMGMEGILPFNAVRVLSFSNDSGQTWAHNYLPEEYFYTGAYHFFNTTVGFIAGFNDFFIKTEDGGQTWQEITYDDPRRASGIYFFDQQNGIATGEDGLVLTTTDGGNTWIVGNCGYNEDISSISALNAENCWLGSRNGRYLKFNTDNTSNTECIGINLPKVNFTENILSISPNPSNGQITVSLENKTNFNQTNHIAIYNNIGQTIYKSSLPENAMLINTKNWPSGIYWLNWFSNTQLIQTKKFIVID